MKTFTRFFALLFAFAIMGSANLNAQWYTETIDGDGGSPLLELWFYGVSGVTPEVGDVIGAFDGGTLVGTLTLTEVPSTAKWLDCQLICYSKSSTGGDLYTPGNAILIKYRDVSLNTTYYAWTWGDGNHIDFHDTWWAPTSDELTATTVGAYYPATGTSSFGYVDLTVSAVQWTNEATINFTVNNADDSAPLDDVDIASGSYTATTAGGGLASIDVYAGDNGDTDLYPYTFSFIHSVTPNIYKTEYVSLNVDATNGPFTVEVYLNAENDISGIVKKYNLTSGLYEVVESALVTTTIYDTVHSDYTDATGAYLIEDLPDGDWDFTYSYNGYVSQTINKTINITGGAATTQDVNLDLIKGKIEGEIFDATTIGLITGAADAVTVAIYDGGVIKDFVTVTDGDYELEYYGGTYDSIYVSTNDPGGGPNYNAFSTGEEYTFYPGITETMNFNLLPTNTDPYFENLATYGGTYVGDPNNMWSIHIEFARFGAGDLLPYDEIGIWDMDQASPDSVLVGYIQLTQPGNYLYSGSNVLKTYSVTTDNTHEFIPGNTFKFHGYDISHQTRYDNPLTWSFNAGVGNYSGNVFPDPAVITDPVSYLSIQWDVVSGELSGTVSDGTAVQGVLVELLNVWTQAVITSTTTDASGNYKFNPLDAGTYDVRFTKSGYTTVIKEDQIVKQGEVTDVDVVFAARVEKWAEYNFTGVDWHFFGRAVEEKDGPNEDDMEVLFDMNGALAGVATYDGSETFTTDVDYQDSWVKDDPNMPTTWEYGAGPWQTYTWDITKGYQIYMEEALGYQFRFKGYVIDPAVNTLSLPLGTSYIPYYPFDYDNPDEAIDAFASIFDELDWVMDENGNRLHNDGGGWIDNIGTLDPTEGYKIKMNTAADLTYPSAKKKSTSNRSFMEPVHYIFEGGNAADWTYTMYINTDEFEIGDEIAAFSNGQIVGSMVIDSDLAWENDLNTFDVTIEGGYEYGSDIVLKGWDRSTGVNYDLEFEMVPEVDDAYVGTKFPAGLDHFSYVNVTRGTVSVDKNQVDNNVRVYPNPTSNMLTIESVSNINEVHVYNLYGALVDVVNVHSVKQTLDVSSYTAGTYMIQLHTDTGVITKRVIIK